MKELTIDFLYLDLTDCERCVATDSSLKEALEILSDVFQILNFSVRVNKVNITSAELAEQYHFMSSPTIRANGIDICGDIKESDCKDCGDLCGDSVDCRVFVYEEKEYEQPPVAMIIDGILRVIYGRMKIKEKPYVLPQNLNHFFKRRESIIKTMSIYEPAMCCETGICGVGIDPELLRIGVAINNLKKNGITIKRYNLNNYPNEFIKNTAINDLINTKGVESLPSTVVDGEIVKTGKYPSNDEIAGWLGIPQNYFGEESKKENADCGCKGGCC